MSELRQKMRKHPSFVKEFVGQTSFVINRQDRKIGLKGILKETVRVIFPLRVKNTRMSKERKRNETKNRA